MFRTAKFQLVELVIGAGVTGAMQDTYFQSQPQLQSVTGDRQIWVKGIETFSNQAMPKSPLTSSNNVATPQDIANGVLVLNVAGTLEFKQIPLAILNRVWADPGAANWAPYSWQLFLLKNISHVDWTQSYVTTIQAPGAVPFSYIFGVHYDYVPDVIDTIV